MGINGSDEQLKQLMQLNPCDRAYPRPQDVLFGGGVRPMCKDLCCRSWSPFGNRNWHNTAFLRAELPQIKDKIVTFFVLLNWTFSPQICTPFCWILSQQTFTHFFNGRYEKSATEVLFSWRQFCSIALWLSCNGEVEMINFHFWQKTLTFTF